MSPVFRLLLMRKASSRDITPVNDSGIISTANAVTLVIKVCVIPRARPGRGGGSSRNLYISNIVELRSHKLSEWGHEVYTRIG